VRNDNDVNNPRELVVISGKGGTGKTSIVASLAALAEEAVLADCDVDAPDLHLILEPRIDRTEPFSGGKQARVLPSQCTGCGDCQSVCQFDAVRASDNGRPNIYAVDPIRCEGCGVCAWFCPDEAIAFEAVENGQWFVSRTRFGPMVHARLHAGEENSGKLVSLVRRQAEQVARREGRSLIISDGSPGIGCPVIASVTGADLALVVTEPTLSGIHDLHRVRELTAHFKIPTVVCVNKYDLNPELTEQIESDADRLDTKVVGRIRYDSAVTKAQIMKASVVEYTGGAVTEDIRRLWRQIVYEMG